MVAVTETAARALARLDRPSQRRLRDFLRERLQGEADPRRTGKALHGRHAGLWRYRVGDYRRICRIDDGRCLVLVLKIVHRLEDYR